MSLHGRRAVNPNFGHDCGGRETVGLCAYVKKNFVGVHANGAACRGVLPVGGGGGVQKNFALIERDGAVDVLNVRLLNLDGGIGNFRRAEVRQNFVAAQKVQCRIVSRAAQNFHAVGNFIGGQERQHLGKTNRVDFGVDNLRRLAERARCFDVRAESFGVNFGGNGIHIRAVGSSKNFINRNIFPVECGVDGAALQKNFRVERRFVFALKIDVVEVPAVVALFDVERRAVDVNFVQCGNGVVAQGKQFEINLRFVDAGNKFVVLVENFNGANSHVAVAVELEQVGFVEVDAADFHGHAEFLRRDLFSFNQHALNNGRSL